MATLDDAFRLLGLSKGAGEREIRRTYARKLKAIDQDAQPEAFQALRDAYETALGRAHEEACLVLADDTTATATMSDDLLLAQVVLERFRQAGAALAASDRGGDVDAWLALLQARLADEELVGIGARHHFETLVASLLAAGWRPGHELMLAAAESTFGWNERRHLLRLGAAGELLDQVIDESALFDLQLRGDHRLMRGLPRMLRRPGLPAVRHIRANMRHVECMLRRFPTWTAVAVGIDNVERWRSAYLVSGAAPIVFEDDAAVWEELSHPPNAIMRHGASIFIVIVLALGIVFASSTGRPVPPRLSLASDDLRAHVPALRFDPATIARPGRYAGAYRVHLDLHGKVWRLDLLQPSGEPALDRAAEEAIRSGAPYHYGATDFVVPYEVTAGRAAQAGP